MWKATGGQSHIISEFCLNSLTIPTKGGVGYLNSATQICYEIIIKVLVLLQLLLIMNLLTLTT